MIQRRTLQNQFTDFIEAGYQVEEIMELNQFQNLKFEQSVFQSDLMTCNSHAVIYKGECLYLMGPVGVFNYVFRART